MLIQFAIVVVLIAVGLAFLVAGREARKRSRQRYYAIKAAWLLTVGGVFLLVGLLAAAWLLLTGGQTLQA